jgi:sulfur transfer complex TusBCD TusB component (DsrH family)
MDEMKYTLLTEVLGRWKAEIVESFLQSEGIEVVLVQDSISLSAYGNPFASVQVFVPKEDLEKARELSKDWEDLLQNEDEEDEAEDPEED